MDKILLRNNPPCGFGLSRRSRDQPQPGSLFSRSWGRGEVDPGNETGCQFSFFLCAAQILQISYSFHRTPLYDHAVAAVDGFVYASAGSVEGKASLLLQEEVQCYNPHLNHWDFVAPMQEARAKAAAAKHEGLLYVSGKTGANACKIPQEMGDVVYQ